MPAISHKVLLRMAIAAGLGVALPALAAGAMAEASSGPTLQCRASIGATEFGWTIELDDAIPLAIVDSEDTPADYSTGHVHIRLAASGPNLVIGLVSGRLVVTAADGSALGRGRCDPLLLASDTGQPGATCADREKPIHRTPACSVPAAFPA